MSVWGEDSEDKDSTTLSGRTGAECVWSQGRGGKGGVPRLRGGSGPGARGAPKLDSILGTWALESLWPLPSTCLMASWMEPAPREAHPVWRFGRALHKRPPCSSL